MSHENTPTELPLQNGLLQQALHQDPALAEVSASVRASQQQDETRVTPLVRAAFAPLHTRLMERIAEDTAVTFLEEAPLSPTRRWPWNNAEAFARKPYRAAQRLAWSAVFATLLVGTTWSAHQIGRGSSPHDLPVQEFVTDFDNGIKSPAPFEFTALDVAGNNAQSAAIAARDAASWLSARAGMTIEVPAARAPGLKLIGARHLMQGERSVAQAHYLQNGVRVALYQVRDARAGLGSLDAVQLGRRTYFTSNHDPYRVVSWRAGEDIMALVSPLAMRESLLLAQRLRVADIHPQKQ